MTTYTKITDYAAKDSLLTGNPSKVVRGTEIDAEFTSIASADADSVKVSGLGANVATFLATPSSANLAAALTDETGTGANVFANSPTLVTPALGTPSSGTLTSCTGLPVATGISGLGTGIATALAVNVGTAGSPVVNGGALGTPSSGTVTNLTGTASININGTVGATTPAAGTFTTLTSTGNATLGDAEASDTHAIKGATTLLANSASAALTVTQTGAGNAFVVEDSASTDSTPFVVTAGGELGVGGTPDYAGKAHKVLITDSTYATLFVEGIATTAVVTSQFSTNGTGSSYQFRKARGSIATPTVVVDGDDIGSIDFQGYDGSANRSAARVLVEVDGTPGTNDMPGRLVFSTTADGASSPTERMRITSGGSVGIGSVPSAGQSFANNKDITGATFGIATISAGQVRSDVTSQARYFQSFANTQATTFTCGDVIHYLADQGAFGSGSTVTTQTGFYASSALVGATNNYGFYGGIAAGTNRYNFYAAGTADNYLAGRLGVGIAPASSTTVYISAVTTDTTSYGVLNSAQAGSPTTAGLHVFQSYPSTQAAAFTLGNLRHFLATQGTIGAGSAVTNQIGYFADSGLTGATNNYGFYSNIASAANRYNFYAAGTADNYFAGAVTCNTTLTVTTSATVGGSAVVTLAASQTLTNKTLTSPTLTTPVLGTPSSGNLSSCTADGTNAVGFLHIPQNSQSAPYTLVLGDAGKHILHPSADTTARTITIPANSSVAFPIGTAVTFVNQASAGVMTIAITTDTMRLAGAGTTGSRTLAANGVATAIKLTSTEWIISGTNLT